MKFCKKCVIPDTRPSVKFNEEGICVACLEHGKRNDVDWDKRHQEFLAVIERAKKISTGYDCLIPVSGGKDSTWQVIKCLEYGLNPLTITTVAPLRTELGQKNLDNLINLGVSHIDYQVSPEVEKKFLRKAFLESGSVGLPMHMAMYRMALNFAVNFNIPYIIWGENSAVEYGGAEKDIAGYKMNSAWLKNYGVSHGTGPEDWIDENLTRKEMTPYFGPTDEEMDAKGIEAIFLGYYFEWDVYNSLRYAEKQGFSIKEDGPKIGYYNFADLDDDVISVHHYLKWYKFGFTRAFDNLSLEIRNGRKTRDEALEILRNLGEQVPDKDIGSFCKFIDITPQEFFETIEKFRNLDIWSKDNGVWKIDDFLIDDWDWRQNGYSKFNI